MTAASMHPHYRHHRGAKHRALRNARIQPFQGALHFKLDAADLLRLRRLRPVEFRPQQCIAEALGNPENPSLLEAAQDVRARESRD